MPALTISRTKTSFLNKIKAAISWTNVNTLNVDDDAPLKPLEKAHPTKPSTTINDLPPEILAIIFHAYMFWEDEPDHVDPELEGVVPVFAPNPCAAPLLFCGVSSYWRNVAISSPALWSSIVIRDTCRPKAIALWLERSQTQPLSLLVSLGQNMANTDKFARLSKMLYANMSRWKHVSFRLPTAKDMQQVMFNLMPQAGKSPAPQLQLLDLPSEAYTTGRHYWWSSTPQVFSVPHSTLRHISWGCHVAPDISRIPETRNLWLNLQQITFSTISTLDLVSFLRVCKNLRVINIKFLHTLSIDDMPTIVAHNLEAFNIGMVVGKLASTICLLKTPNLKRLRFTHRAGGKQAVVLEKYIARLGCKLEYLCIVNKSPDLGEDEIRTLLQSPLFTSIPRLSLRVVAEACRPFFPHLIIRETAGQWKSIAYAYYDHKIYSYHFGWGSRDNASAYSADYPFLVGT
ncbi:hypothetical protein CVT24_009515 [Panaeolus cyanescens]|uniref:F-box domain-containing protein n=1 Tax=Panaeolus cyanescens TaxID=181874 RepID=A0A409VYB3_9AGAR|nr:hypothetical protein CVT24_009515 [Panaeolus cyanescens]